jgi:hypothetical protein
MADRVDFISVNLPALLRRPAFQVGMRLATAPTRRCSSERPSLLRDRGAPRYLQGNGATWQGNTSCTAGRCDLVVSAPDGGDQIRHLSTFVLRPEAPANSSRSCRM